MTRKTKDRFTYAAVWIACFLPLPMVVYWIATDQLSADPAPAGGRRRVNLAKSVRPPVEVGKPYGRDTDV